MLKHSFAKSSNILFLKGLGSVSDMATTDFSGTLSALIDRLFCKYQQHVRPARKVDVELVVAMGRLIDVDEANGVFEAMIINGIIWNDDRLKWDPLTNDNITEFVYAVDRLWIPDIRIYDALNGPDVGGISGHQHGLALISHDGKVVFMPQKIVKGPIDTAAEDEKENETEQGKKGKKIVLSVKYGPWAHPSSAVQLKATTCGIDIKSVNPKWKVLKSTLKEITETYSSCPNQPYSEVKLIMHVNRNK